MLDKLRMWYWIKKMHLRTLWATRGWKPGDWYEACAGEPLQLISISFDGDMTGKTWDGKIRMCSFYHCGPVKVNR